MLKLKGAALSAEDAHRAVAEYEGSLRVLDFSFNALASFADLHKHCLSNLTHLDLSDNLLRCFPSPLGSLSSLVSLCLDNNEITQIPEEISKCAFLEDLSLENNDIADVPVAVARLARLKFLILEGCKRLAMPIDDVILRNTSLCVLVGAKKAQMVTDGVYLGPIEAERPGVLPAAVTAVVNCCTAENSVDKSVKVLRLQLLDVPQQPLAPAIRRASEFIEHCLSRGGAVLVHCEAGMSRSAGILCGYLQTKRQLTFDQAMLLIRRARPVACPNQGFQDYLRSI